METNDANYVGGSLQISTDVIAKIARLSALEISGISEITTGNTGMRGMFSKVNMQKPIVVELSDDVAEITLYVAVRYGIKIPPVCEAVQESVKNSVQNMTGITVSKVNIVVTGIALEQAVTEE